MRSKAMRAKVEIVIRLNAHATVTLAAKDV